MKLKGFGIIIAAMALLACAGQVMATQYSFSFNGTASGSGNFSTSGEDIVNGNITIDDYGTLQLLQVSSLVPTRIELEGGNVWFEYNNKFNNTDPYFDKYGVMFSSLSNIFANIYYDSDSESYQIGVFKDWNQFAFGGIDFELSNAPVPEPSTLLLLGGGLLGLGFARKRFAKK